MRTLVHISPHAPRFDRRGRIYKHTVESVVPPEQRMEAQAARAGLAGLAGQAHPQQQQLQAGGQRRGKREQQPEVLEAE